MTEHTLTHDEIAAFHKMSRKDQLELIHDFERATLVDTVSEQGRAALGNLAAQYRQLYTA